MLERQSGYFEWPGTFSFYVVDSTSDNNKNLFCIIGASSIAESWYLILSTLKISLILGEGLIARNKAGYDLRGRRLYYQIYLRLSTEKRYIRKDFVYIINY